MIISITVIRVSVVRERRDELCSLEETSCGCGVSIGIRKGNGLATLFNTIHDLRFSYFE